MGQSGQLAAVRVLDAGGSHDSFKELSLQDHFLAEVNIIGFDSETLVKLFKVLFFFLFVAAAGVVMVFDPSDLVDVLLGVVDEVELVDLGLTKQGEVVLLALVVNAIKLGQGAVRANDLGVAEESPDLAQGHGERLLALGRLDLLSVELVPILEVSVVPQEDVLAFFLDLGRVLLEIDQVRDVNQLAEGVLLDLFLRQVASFSLRRLNNR